MNHSGGGQSNKLTGQDIQKHNSKDSCWVIIHGKAYDVTEFLPEHPGGPKIILKYAGKDATEEYAPIHPPDTLDKYLDKKFHLGEVDMGSVKQEEKEVDPDEEDRLERVKRMPILEQCYNLMDFEAVARRVMKKTAWAYYSSGADDEIVGIFQAGILAERANMLTTDNAREPYCLPQDLVPTANPRRCREDRSLDYHARLQSLDSILRHSNCPRQAGESRGRSRSHKRRKET